MPPKSLALMPTLLYQERLSNPRRPMGEGPEGPWLGGKTQWEVARATKFPWVLEKGGFLPSSPHPHICLGPHLPHFRACLKFQP